jgi:murein L,D-transpeptidase YcbB/YkuD
MPDEVVHNGEKHIILKEKGNSVQSINYTIQSGEKISSRILDLCHVYLFYTLAF